MRWLRQLIDEWLRGLALLIETLSTRGELDLIEESES